MFRYINRVDWRFLLLNLLFLMVVAFVPYPTALVAKYLASETGRSIAVMFYGGVMTAFAMTYNALWWYASAGGRLLVPDVDPEAVRRVTRQFAVALIGYAVATGVAFFQPVLSLVLFVAMAMFSAIAPAIRGGDKPLRDASEASFCRTG